MLFLLQIAAIAAGTETLGRLFRKFGQPRVIGEMVAGICLGPSLLGWLAPGFYGWLFPESSITLLNLAGQLGLVFYMFLVGMEVNVKHWQEQRVVAMVTSLSSILVPLSLGVLLAALSYHPLSLPGVPLPAFALFVGACLSVTAFPVLARILQETGLITTRLGSIALACAAVNDVSAWLILAAILAFVRAPAQDRPLWLTLGGMSVYIILMLAVRRVWSRLTARSGGSRAVTLAPALIFALISASATEWIGVHALFGAFFAGVVIPKNQASVGAVRGTVEPLTAAVFLPVFFAMTGLRTRFGLALAAGAWGYTLTFLAVAIVGKWLGAMVAARSMGMEKREANALGILMNTRGLVELVILNVGYELGMLSPAVFSMLVMMALLTTFMTTPLLQWVYPWKNPIGSEGERLETTA